MQASVEQYSLPCSFALASDSQVSGSSSSSNSSVNISASTTTLPSRFQELLRRKMQAEAASQDRSPATTVNDAVVANAQAFPTSTSGFYTGTLTTPSSTSSSSATSFNYGPSWEQSLPLVAQAAVRNLATDQAAFNRALLETYANVTGLKNSSSSTNVKSAGGSSSSAKAADGLQAQPSSSPSTSSTSNTMSFASGGGMAGGTGGQPAMDYYTNPFPQTLPMYKPQSQQSAYFQRMMAIKLANAAREDLYSGGNGGVSQQQQSMAPSAATPYDHASTATSGSRLPTYPNLSTNDVTVDLGTFLPTSSSPLYQMLPNGFSAAAAVAAAAANGGGGGGGGGPGGNGEGVAFAAWPYGAAYADVTAAANGSQTGFQPQHSRSGSNGGMSAVNGGGGEAEHGGPSRSYSPQIGAVQPPMYGGFPGWLPPNDQMAIQQAWSRSMSASEETYQQPPATMRVPFYGHPGTSHPYFMANGASALPDARFDIDPSLNNGGSGAASHAGPSRTSEEAESSTASAAPPAKKAKLGKKTTPRASERQPKENRIPIDQVRLVKPEGPKKAVLACHFCRGRKLRCDGAFPCTHCARRSIDCSYDDSVRRRGPGKHKKSDEEKAAKKEAKKQDRHPSADGSATEEKPKSKRGRKPKAKVPAADADGVSEAGGDVEKSIKAEATTLDPALAHAAPTGMAQGDPAAYSAAGASTEYNVYAEGNLVGT